VNRSLARTKPGSSPNAKRGRPARTNGTLHSRLKITSSIRRQSHQQDRPKPGLHMRELRCERRTAQQRELPQPLPGMPVLQARRHRPRRPGLGLPRHDAPRARRTPWRQRTRAGPPVRHLRLRPSQPDRRRPRARRRHRRDHRADVQSRLAPRPVPTRTPSWAPCPAKIARLGHHAITVPLPRVSGRLDGGADRISDGAACRGGSPARSRYWCRSCAGTRGRGSCPTSRPGSAPRASAPTAADRPCPGCRPR
jgi:hypothetical protein